MKSVLVICEGNICRSPMGAGLLANRMPGLHVQSAGLGALIGRPADPAAIELMQELGIDITAHRATQVTRAACAASDLVLVMDHEQRSRLQQLYPQVRGRVFRLGEHIGEDIPDPYRHPLTVFRSALSLIDQGIDQWMRRIERL